MTFADPLGAALARLDAGTPWKEALEELLLDLPASATDRFMQVLREARGSWLGLLYAGAGRALFVGEPLSGTPVALARAGFAVCVADGDETALRLGAHRTRDGAPPPAPSAHAVRCEPRSLPFRSDAFDLVVVEGRADDRLIAEARRVGSGELVLVADNRFAYKRWSGTRGAFHVPGPLEYLRAALDPRRPERSLAGYRRVLTAGGVQEVRSFALYPHALDFALIAGLDGPRAQRPRLFIGPKERENRAKVLGYRLGLLPLATPSFALLAARSAGARRRVDRVLDALAERLGEPRPEILCWISSRGNTSVIQTRAPGAPEQETRGRWTLHIPHQRYQERQARRHFRRIGELRARFPGVPVPEPLFGQALEGLPVFCERRVVGMTAPQAVGDHERLARTFGDAARHLAQLVVEEDAELDEAALAELIDAKFDLVRRHAARDATQRALDRMRDETRERLAGRRLPRVLYHADLRSKHVVIGSGGEVAGYLDWGSSEASDLPYFDLLHLIVHERKQERRTSAGEAWRLALGEEGLRPTELAALDDYCARIGLDPEVRAALEGMYPVLVAAMAEKNWDYSRPRWFHASFDV
ncbi:MAG: phosphotransferase [Planctomycetota bacterium]